MKAYSIKQKLGALLLDALRFLWHVKGPASHWTRYGNRRDECDRNPAGPGIACGGEFTRSLHLCDVFPRTAHALLSAALRENPIQFADAPSSISEEPFTPEVSFIIGHRGLDRLPLLLLTLRSIAAQQGVPFECIVVEQDDEPRIRDLLPSWVQYLHTPLPEANRPFSRSWAFNEGAALARGHLLIFHDNDMLVPARYAEEGLNLSQEGMEVIQMKRYIFYLNEASSRQVVSTGNIREPLGCEQVIENLLAGGSLAISKSVYWEIGGFDEAFIGWGGEDNEFWDRCLTREVWPYGFLPLIHLWHAPQEGKRAVNGMGAQTADLTLRRRAIPPAERIAELKARPDRQRRAAP